MAKGWLFSLLFIALSCKSVQHISHAQAGYQVIGREIPVEDAEVLSVIAPYKAALDATMNEVIAILPETLQKQKPESPLGNWVADVVVKSLRAQGYEVDLAVINYGGLRVPYLSQGPLTIGEVFELAPFDNTVMVLDISGAKLDSFIMLVVEAGGWPISEEARVIVKDGRVQRASISEMPIDHAKTYRLATLDYLATGGDNMKVLIPVPRTETGLLFRDVLIEFIRAQTALGNEIRAINNGRIQYQ